MKAQTMGIYLQGLVILCFCCMVIMTGSAQESGRERSVVDEESLKELMTNVSSECYRSRRECDSRCAVTCEEIEECGGVRHNWYRCPSNYWLVIILIVVLALFLLVLLVACQCIDKGQGCENVDLYPRILGNHRRSQRRGINTVQYFTSVRPGRGRTNRKASSVSYTDSFTHRASLTSQTPLTEPTSHYRYL